MKAVLGKTVEFPPGATKYVELGRNRVLVCNVAGQYYACGAECPHRGANLAQGVLEGHAITCPWHEWVFDVRTGAGITNPISHVPQYQVQVEDDCVILITPDDELDPKGG